MKKTFRDGTLSFVYKFGGRRRPLWVKESLFSGVLVPSRLRKTFIKSKHPVYHDGVEKF